MAGDQWSRNSTRLGRRKGGNEHVRLVWRRLLDGLV